MADRPLTVRLCEGDPIPYFRGDFVEQLANLLAQADTALIPLHYERGQEVRTIVPPERQWAVNAAPPGQIRARIRTLRRMYKTALKEEG